MNRRAAERPDSRRADWLAELADSRETVLQAAWAHQMWHTRDLRTADGRALEVVFPGWLNRGAGPDFTEARIRIGGEERFGDVEVHLAETGWRQHGHDRDPAYRRVVLHVVLARGGDAPALGARGETVPVLEARTHLHERVRQVLADPEALLETYANLPGRCGLRAGLLGSDALTRVVAHAAEARARQKADALAPLWEGFTEEQILFELIFTSLGYRPHAETFRALARRFPLRSLLPLLERPEPEARDAVLCRWFGAGGLLEAEPGQAQPPALRDQYARWRADWRALDLRPQGERLSRRGSRPWNSPERRLVGLYHHLRATVPAGWLKRWLSYLVELDGLRDAKRLRQAATRKLEAIFTTPADEPWREHVSFAADGLKTGAALIGRDRMIVVMANAVIPFFLAYARRRRDRELEKLLYRLFIVLPPEAPNHKTRFMDRRLVLFSQLPRTLRTQQGLLQIHQDYCTSFDAGCAGCRFPDLIGPARLPDAREGAEGGMVAEGQGRTEDS